MNHKTGMRIIIGFIIFIFLLVTGVITTSVIETLNVSYIDATVVSKTNKVIGTKDVVSMKNYVVITYNDGIKELVTCETSIIHGFYIADEKYYSLSIDSTYRFKLTGYSKSFWWSYRNIIEYEQLNN
jgi:hypothetical protein